MAYSRRVAQLSSSTTLQSNRESPCSWARIRGAQARWRRAPAEMPRALQPAPRWVGLQARPLQALAHLAAAPTRQAQPVPRARLELLEQAVLPRVARRVRVVLLAVPHRVLLARGAHLLARPRRAPVRLARVALPALPQRVTVVLRPQARRAGAAPWEEPRALRSAQPCPHRWANPASRASRRCHHHRSHRGTTTPWRLPAWAGSVPP